MPNQLEIRSVGQKLIDCLRSGLNEENQKKLDAMEWELRAGLAVSALEEGIICFNHAQCVEVKALEDADVEGRSWVHALLNLNTTHAKSKPVCRNCGSSNMSFEAIAKWNAGTNSLICTESDIHPYDDSESRCLDCGAENSDDWVLIEG